MSNLSQSAGDAQWGEPANAALRGWEGSIWSDPFGAGVNITLVMGDFHPRQRGCSRSSCCPRGSGPRSAPRAADVLRLFVGQGAVLALAGIFVGLLAAVGLPRFLAGMLYEVSTLEPVTFAAVALLLAGMALLASYLPARRATQVAPLEALRHD